MHITTLLLGGISPYADGDFLYAGKFEGEAARLLDAAGISRAEKSAEAILSEFQRSGFFLAHVLECPLERGAVAPGPSESLLIGRCSQVVARIRRSLKPKRIVLISELLSTLSGRLSSAELGCLVVLDQGKPFALDSADPSGAILRLRETIVAASVAR